MCTVLLIVHIVNQGALMGVHILKSAICDCYDLCSNLCEKNCKYMVDLFGSHGTCTMYVPVLFYMHTFIPAYNNT